ncbi:MAG: signal peptidase I [Paenibacillaceae bacterium]
MTGSDQNLIKKKNELFEWTKALLIAAALVFLIRWLAFTPFIVDGESMLPNFNNEERMIVNKLIYDFRDPQRFEVIVFLAPEGKDFIKRVIGLPGDKVRVDGDNVYINGEPISEPYIQEEIDQAAAEGKIYNSSTMSITEEVTVPKDSLFVMGDNRPRSKDSRFSQVGFVPYDAIVGRADVVYWPLSSLRLIKHYGGEEK